MTQGGLQLGKWTTVTTYLQVHIFCTMDNPAMDSLIKIIFANKNGRFFFAFDGKNMDSSNLQA